MLGKPKIPKKIAEARIYQLIGTRTGISDVDERSDEIIELIKTDNGLLNKLKRFSEDDLVEQDGNILKNYVGAYISKALAEEEKVLICRFLLRGGWFVAWFCTRGI